MHNMEPFNKILRKLIEQDADLVLINFERQMTGLSFDEQTVATKHGYIYYSGNKKRIMFKKCHLV